MFEGETRSDWAYNLMNIMGWEEALRRDKAKIEQLLTDSVPNLLEATRDDLKKIKGVGPKTVDCFLEKRDEAR